MGADFASAKALTRKIKDGKLGEEFSIKDVYRPGWSYLSSSADAWRAVEILEEFDWLFRREQYTKSRKRTVFQVNPLVWADK
jgi:hypothetical protein